MYASREFIPIQLEVIIALINHGSVYVDKVTSWFSKYLHCCNFAFKLTAGWQKRLADLKAELQSRLHIGTNFSIGHIRAQGLVLACTDLLFHSETLPPYQVPTGTILTDGYTVIFRTVDTSKGRKSALNGYDADDFTGDFRQLFIRTVDGMAALKQAAHARVDFGTHWRIPNAGGQPQESPILPTLDLLHASLPCDRLSEANRRAAMTGRHFVDNPTLAQPETKDGLPITIPRLTQEIGREFLLAHGVSEADIHAGHLSIVANDPGFRFDQAIRATVQLNDDTWVERDLLSKPQGEQTIIQHHVTRCQFLTAVERAKLKVTAMPDPIDILSRNSRAHLKARYEKRRLRGQYRQRKIDQFAQTVGLLASGNRPTRPAGLVTPGQNVKHHPANPVIFALGDAGGPMAHVKRHAVDSRNSFLRALASQAEARRWPMLIAFVSEYKTSQVCPDSLCRANFMTTNDLPRYVCLNCGVPLKCIVALKLDITIAFIGRLIHPTVTDTGRPCFRISQCPSCHKIYHRDLAAACNIHYVAKQLITKGTEPFREVVHQDDMANGGMSAMSSVSLSDWLTLALADHENEIQNSWRAGNAATASL